LHTALTVTNQAVHRVSLEGDCVSKCK